MTLLRAAVAALFAIGVVAAGVYFLGIGDGTDEAANSNGRDRQVFARVVSITTQPEIVRLEAVGTGRSVRSVMLYPDSEGEVTEVAFEPSQQVSKGDILLRLDDEDEALAVNLAEVRVKDAEQLLARYNRAQSGAVSATQIDSARNALASARVELDQARVALEDRYIRAPFDGTVGLTDIDEGDRVGTDTEIAPFDDLSALLIDFVVPEQLSGRIEAGDTVMLKPWTADSEPVEGRIAGIDSRIDPRTRAFRARARIDNPGPDLRPGMSFRVTAELRGSSYPVVPEASIVWGGNGSFVWEVRDGIATGVPIVIVQRNPGEVLVEADLTAGDLVVYEGVQSMREGIPVDYETVGPIASSGDKPPAVRIDSSEGAVQ